MNHNERIGRKPQCKEQIIYNWFEPNENAYFAAVKLNGKLYGFNWLAEKPFYSNTKSKKVWKQRARHNAITNVQNTLNAIRLYGKKVLDENGDVDFKKFQEQERIMAQVTPLFEQKFKILKYPVENITPEKAREFNLI